MKTEAEKMREEIEFFASRVCKATQPLDRDQRLVVLSECLRKWFQFEDENTRFSAACYVIEKQSLNVGKRVFGYDIDDDEA